MGKLKNWWWIIGIIVLSSIVGISIAFFYNQSTNESKIVFNQIKEIKQIDKQQHEDDYMAGIQNNSLEKIIYVNPINCLVGALLDYEVVTVGNYGKNSELENITIFVFEEKNNTKKSYIEIDIHSPHWSKSSINNKKIIYKNKKINATNIKDTKIVFGEYNDKTNKDIQYTAILSFEDVEYYFISYQKLERHAFVEYILKWSENLYR